MSELRKKIVQKKIYLIYCVCTIGVIWTGVWRDIGNGAQWALAINCIGICVFPMIICRYSLRDFLKPLYFIWIIVFLVFAYPIYSAIKPGTDYDMQYLTAVMNVGLYGLAAIHTICFLLKEQKKTLFNMTVIFWCWVAVFIWATISVNKSIYPIWFLAMFGSLYLAPSNVEKKHDMINGITTGIIISFFWIQGRAFLYRPYDTGPQYYGHFTNSSINCMFYLTVYTAWLYKLWNARKNNRSAVLKCIIGIFTFSMLDFVYLTGSRGGVISAASVTLLFLIICTVFERNGFIREFLIQGIILTLIAIIMFAPVYSFARYIPALRHHPVWYRDYSEDKVHSWDPIDSEKYTTFEEALGNFTFMKGKTLGVSSINIEDISEWERISSLVASIEDDIVPESYLSQINVSKYIDYSDLIYILEYNDGVEPGSDEYHPAGVLPNSGQDSYLGALGVRKYIYKFFITKLNICGHEEVYPHVYFGPWLGYYGHTHNTFIQIAYCFGIPAGIAFLLICVMGVLYPFTVVRKKNKVTVSDYIFPSLFLTAYITYGLIDCLSLLGNVMYSVLFLAVLPLMSKIVYSETDGE